MPRVAPAAPPLRRSASSSGHRRRASLCPLAGAVPALYLATNHIRVTTWSSPAASPAKNGGELAGIWPPAPPCHPKECIVRSILFPRTLLQTKGIYVKLVSFQGLSCERDS
jgi:hypothetical protein